ncbi:mannosyltransferase [Seonamhaeicola marinus]|uniref:Mannosyltransferase n=1 Tax=Seonamhaeicola marinus TaxID=1912246 RepID=A0A5D0HG43_9FLAO|nr:mannosyltransferase [Seonamhaeicola marinus]TYA69900.1 mannosyltransferase [Seonamhaeicola marinus]
MQLNLSLLKLNKTAALLTLFSCLLYGVFAYQLERTEYLKLVLLYTILFGLFYWLIKKYKNNLKLLTAIGFIFRTVFILAIPNLSQDFYRFIWDGSMILEGLNPYLYTVQSFIDDGNLPVANGQELYNGMGELNAGHFTNYPPINQLCFVLANLFPGAGILSSVIGLRLIIIAADFGTLFFGKRLLQNLNLPSHNIFWYLLNPFIIIELTGNLHFEGVMIFFLVWSLYLLQKGKWQWSAVVLALSVSTKLVPLIFLPLFFKWFVKRNVIAKAAKPSMSDVEIASSRVPHNDNNWIPYVSGITKLIGFYAIVGVITILLFAPFFSTQFISNYAETVGLWFQNFEFNASLYYIARAIGYTFRGYNEIAIIGKVTPLIVILFVLLITFFRKNNTSKQLITAMLLVLSFYYFTSTTVHPWYVATLLILSIFTNYKFPLVWSFTIILSYLAYMQIGNANKSENLLVIALEYLVVYGVFFYEVFKKKTKPA